MIWYLLVSFLLTKKSQLIPPFIDNHGSPFIPQINHDSMLLSAPPSSSSNTFHFLHKTCGIINS